MSNIEKLSKLYKQANQYNEEYPKELMDKLSIYGKILEIIGGLHSEAVKDWKLAEMKRRETIASGILYSTDALPNDGEKIELKTAKDREAAAEILGAEARREEARAEAEATRWKNAKDSTSEQIQIMKKRYEHLVNVAKGGI